MRWLKRGCRGERQEYVIPEWTCWASPSGCWVLIVSSQDVYIVQYMAVREIWNIKKPNKTTALFSYMLQWETTFCVLYFWEDVGIFQAVLVATKQDIFSRDGDISLQYFLDQASEKLSISAGRPYTHTMQVVTMFELKKKDNSSYVCSNWTRYFNPKHGLLHA